MFGCPILRAVFGREGWERYTPCIAMPAGLRRYQRTQNLHFITFSCYRRQPFLETDADKDVAERILEETRRRQGLRIAAYVLMPEHVHLLTDEPARDTLAIFLQIFKQLTSRELKPAKEKQLWQRTHQRLQEMKESRHPKPPLFRPSSRSVLPMPIAAPAAAPAAAIVLPAAMSVRGGHRHRTHIVFADPLQSPAAAASASSAASAQSRAEIADAHRRIGKCVPAMVAAARPSAGAAGKRAIHFRIVDAKP